MAFLAISLAFRSFLSISQRVLSRNESLRSSKEGVRRPNQAFPSLNQGVRSLRESVLRLNEALITLNAWVRLAKWPLIRLNAPRIKLAQPRIRPSEALNLPKGRLI